MGQWKFTESRNHFFDFDFFDFDFFAFESFQFNFQNLKDTWTLFNIQFFRKFLLSVFKAREKMFSGEENEGQEGNPPMEKLCHAW